jgi:hypothetical protein
MDVPEVQHDNLQYKGSDSVCGELTALAAFLEKHSHSQNVQSSLVRIRTGN